MVDRATAFSLTAVAAMSGLSACRHAEIPYDLSRVDVEDRPVHALRVALLPFDDARTREDGPDKADRYVYQGAEYVHTELEDLRGSPLARVTEIVARHLAASHLFMQVILVQSPEQAPEADLLMRGTVRRMRGYVEADPPDAKSGRPKNERFVLAEVVLADIEVRDARARERVLMSLDAGWSLHERRSTGDRAPDPWEILSEALFKAVSDLVVEIKTADLSGATVVRDRVQLDLARMLEGAAGEGRGGLAGEAAVGRDFGQLEGRPPPGWRFVETGTVTHPRGWKTDQARCHEVKLVQLQTLRFHRVLGPYRPSVVLWACPDDIHLVYDAMEEFPAIYLGERSNGFRYFAHALGQSNWPDALDEIRAHLSIVVPESRYVFELEERK